MILLLFIQVFVLLFIQRTDFFHSRQTIKKKTGDEILFCCESVDRKQNKNRTRITDRKPFVNNNCYFL